MTDIVLQDYPGEVTVENPYPGFEQILYKGIILACILRVSYKTEGIHFFTPGYFSQQLGYMNRPRGYTIAPHTHNPVPRTIEWTQEALFIRSGLVRVDFFAPETNEYLMSRLLQAGDVILLAHGGHGFYMNEDSEMIEIKQGPYTEAADKKHFEPVSAGDVRGI